MNNHLTGSGALDRDKGHAADFCDRSWSGMATSCVSSTHVKRIERSRRLSTARQPMNNHLTGSGALDRDKGHAADLCNRSWSGMAASCVSSTHVKRIERSRRQRIARKGRLPIPKGRDYALKECGRVCHVFKSKKPSSQRTQGGAVAFEMEAKSMCGYRKKKRNHRQNIKSRRLHAHLINCLPPTAWSHLCWSHESLANVCLVFDGGTDVTHQLEPPPPKLKSKHPATKESSKLTKILPWKALRISKGDLWIADTRNPAKGITYIPSSGDTPFTRIPRRKALEMTGMLSMEESNKFCTALNYGYKCQRASLCRGNGKRIFSDYKYCNMGVQACRAARGVRESSYHRDSMPVEQWDNIVEMMKRTENALSSFVDTKSLRQLNAAKKMLKYKTMATSSSHLHPNYIFGGLAFGINVHLSCHTDHDYTWSVVSLHLLGYQYKLIDGIIAYFCFPRLGVAVPLRPGDILVFNPTEPHAISSRCNREDKVYCLSMYLKTAVVGLNDNTIPLTSTEDIAKDEYNNVKK
jgi:hypothetical protein